MKLMIAGGGTGGHIYPALSIADAFEKNIPDCEVIYVGTAKGLEATVVPAYGYKFKTIEISGFKRNLSAENLLRGIKAIGALATVRKIIKQEKPDLVIGTGGYVCGPVVMTAALMKIPTAIHEQNVFPGMTNKLLAPWSNYVFLGFEKARDRFKKKDNLFFCGNPIRTEKFNITKTQAREKLGIAPDVPMILSMGGSGGSATLNTAMAEIIPQIVAKDIALVHVTGTIHYRNFMENIENVKRTSYQRIEQYLEDIPDYMAAADLIIGSGGAISLAEINYLGKASIIVPKAYTAENHQEYNGKMIEEAGAGYCILEKDLTKDGLREKIWKILQEDGLRFSMEEQSKALSKNQPEEIIYNILRDKLKLRTVGKGMVEVHED